jgi:hypothetical protein
MTDDEIIERLQCAGAGRSATELAELLDHLAGGGLSYGTLVTYFKRAFPRVPLRVLLDAGRWSRIGGNSMSDAQLDELLRPWLP